MAAVAQLMVQVRNRDELELAGIRASARRRCSSAIESGPPDSAATTRVVGVAS